MPLPTRLASNKPHLQWCVQHDDMHGHMQVVKGIVEGCRQSDCALLGGEVRHTPAFHLSSKCLNNNHVWSALFHATTAFATKGAACIAS